MKKPKIFWVGKDRSPVGVFTAGIFDTEPFLVDKKLWRGLHLESAITERILSILGVVLKPCQKKKYRLVGVK